MSALPDLYQFGDASSDDSLWHNSATCEIDRNPLRMRYDYSIFLQIFSVSRNLGNREIILISMRVVVDFNPFTEKELATT